MSNNKPTYPKFYTNEILIISMLLVVSLFKYGVYFVLLGVKK